MSLVKLSNFECHYEFENFGHDEVILFSNSLGTDFSMWEKQVDILSHHYNILRYDTRGHGLSTNDKEELTIAELGQDIIELLDYLKLETVTFCGLSMGGLIGQWLGINHPERFDKIIISNTAAKIGTAEGWNTRIKEVTENGLASITDGTALRWFTADFRKDNPKEVSDILEKFAKNDVKGYCANCAAVRDADFRDQLQNLEVPTMIISGLQDEVTTVEDGKFMAKKIPNSRHFEINAAHLSNVELFEEFSKYIIFFKQH
ncbi:3-oxoadipate enol-lactonase [Flavobacterium sp. W1B]|uniref:3-oxoadipate enol-lactonase n=1 Tax=Flavobacterium sp. W1B TaxID=3394146 RepID=UPI0039BC65B3